MCGEVSVLVPRLLQTMVGGSEVLSLDVGDGATVAQLLDVIGAQFPKFTRRLRDETGAQRRYVNIYLDGEDIRRLAGLQTRATAGQELMVIQSVAGG